MSDYRKFVARKLDMVQWDGIDADLRDYALFPHQRDLTAWALRRGSGNLRRYRTPEKCGWRSLGPTLCATRTGRPVMILCPLAVAQQFVARGLLMGIRVDHVRERAT